MLIGIEYVVVAYVIWLFTFVCYIFMTKRRLKITNRVVAALEEKFTESSTHSMTEKNK